MAAPFPDRLEHVLRASPLSIPRMEGRAAAVLVPVLQHPVPSLIFTVRTDTLPSHKGQISFPGGSIEEGEDARAAALREAHEEIGLEPPSVRVLGELQTFPTFVSGFVVTPIVGWIAETPALEPNPSEVAAVLQVPLEELSEDVRREPGFSHRDRTFPTEAWVWNDNVIWGVTARILRLLLIRLGEAGLVEPPGETMSWAGFPGDVATR